jgi:hypothetical protein
MAKVHIARDGKIIGSHDEHAVPALVALGEVRRTDHFWRRGMGAWAVVGRTFDRPAAIPGSPAATPPAAQPVPRPAGHIRFTCLRCGNRFNEPREVKTGSFLTELFYWAISPVAGGLYTAGRALSTRQTCPRCDSEQINDEPW